MFKLTRCVAGLAVSFALASGAIAQALTEDEIDFMKQAAENGHAEVESAKLAQKKTSSPQVKSFAQHMITDHTKANKELMALAKEKGVELPKEPSVLQKGKLKLLSTKEGSDFDEAYADQMGVQAHESTIELFQEGAKEAKDPKVKAYATKTLPTLKQHLGMAEKLETSTDKKQ